MRVAVVILNWNGKSFLEKFLPTVIEYSTDANIYVADNASTDDSVAFLRSKFPSVKVIENDGNLGFAGGYNAALKHLEEDIFVLLNSDVEVTKNWIIPIAMLMESDTSIGACQPKILQYGNTDQFEYAGAAGGFIDKHGFPFCRGRIFNHLENDKGQYDNRREVFWATGACMFVRSSAYKALGGLDDDFFAHMEEIDLCWRMKRAGYKVMVEPFSEVHHVGGGTLSKSNPRKTYLNFRNGLELLIKNLPRKRLISTLLIRMGLDGIAAWKFLLSGQSSDFLAVFKAHMSFYKGIRKSFSKRKGNYENINSIYQKSIVFSHFLGSAKEFSQLSEDDFS
jgi:hypothetical protein